jgi:hypothetical protein
MRERRFARFGLAGRAISAARAPATRTSTSSPQLSTNC